MRRAARRDRHLQCRRRPVRLAAAGQGVHSLGRQLAEAVFNMPPDRITVRAPEVGGGFGVKNFLYPEWVLVLWAARRLGRPVKWIADAARSSSVLRKAATITRGRAWHLTAMAGFSPSMWIRWPISPSTDHRGNPAYYFISSCMATTAPASTPAGKRARPGLMKIFGKLDTETDLQAGSEDAFGQGDGPGESPAVAAAS